MGAMLSVIGDPGEPGKESHKQKTFRLLLKAFFLQVGASPKGVGINLGETEKHLLKALS